MPSTDFGLLMRLFLEASKSVWNNPAVWIEERDRKEVGPLLAWPLSEDQPTQHQWFLAALFNAETEVVLGILHHQGHPAAPDGPVDAPSATDPKLQLVLRVMHRALAEGEKAMVARFGDGEIVSGRREYRNLVREGFVDWAIRSGVRRAVGDKIFEAVGISHAGAYRAMKRKGKRKR